MAGMVSLK